MKTLLLMRHAKSSWADPGGDDHERPLNKRGKRDAPRMAQFLREQGIALERIVTSTAERARQTAQGVAENFGDVEVTEEPGLYLASARAYLDAARSTDDAAAALMLIGHNPGIEEAVALFTGEHETMSTAAIAHIEFDVPRWESIEPAGGTLLAVWRPKEIPT